LNTNQYNIKVEGTKEKTTIETGKSELKKYNIKGYD